MLRWLNKWLSGRPPPDLAAGTPAEAQSLAAVGARANIAGRHAEAVPLLIRAIEACPGVAEYHYQLGTAMRGLSEPARAVTCFRMALEIDPAHVDAHIDLAATMLALQLPERAEHHAREALRYAPARVPALVNLGAALEAQNRLDEALERYRAALALDPSCVAALLNLSSVALRVGLLDEAEKTARHALLLEPGSTEATQRLGNALLELGRAPQAEALFRSAAEANPGVAGLRNSLGHALDVLGREEEALACYEEALALDPGNVQAHVNRASLLLLRGDWSAGWDEYEWRLRDPRQAGVHERFRLPLWKGEPLEGKRVLVYAEQGLGDEIMYASCLPDLLSRGAACLLDCDARLQSLFRRSFPDVHVHGGRQDDAPDWVERAGGADYRIPLPSLAHHFRRAAGAFPSHAGYLRADPERVARWRLRLEALGPGRKIGLSWRGGVPSTGRGARSLPLDMLRPLLGSPGNVFVSLQYGESEADRRALEGGRGFLHHWSEAIQDYEETAALVCALDLIVSVCTAVVHLAGALGRPAWVLAPLRPEARYGRSGVRMPWYPSVRVFRQSRYSAWEPVVEAVAAALREKG